MAIDLEYAAGTAVTVTNTETSLSVDGGTTTGVPRADTNAGSYMLFLDGVANMVKGDEYRVRIYERARTGGTTRLVFSASISDAQSEMFVTPPLMLGLGWDITLTRISATSRAFDWSVRRVS